MSKRNWTLVFFDGGHKYFFDENEKEYAVADGSGYYPDETDDGILWLNLSEPLSVDIFNGSVSISVPLLDKDKKKKVWTGATVSEAVKLIEHFSFKVRTPRKKYMSDLFKILSKIDSIKQLN